VKRITQKLPAKRQTMFFSATMPTAIRKLASSLVHDAKMVAVDPVSSAVEVVEQSVYFTDKDRKRDLLVHLLDNDDFSRVVVFTRTKHGSDRVARHLEKAGKKVAAIHGNKAQNARTRALDGFKSGDIQVLVATDIAARGIDVDDISHVVNFELPNVPETYVHRIGRTGRAGKGGTAISLCDAEERSFLIGIERLTGKRLSVVEEHPYLPTTGRAAPSANSSPHPGSSGSGRRDHGSKPFAARGSGGGGSGRKPERGPSRFGARGSDSAGAQRSASAPRPRNGERGTASAPRFR
jgi:ATP-dependent RNA helicase RhlE